MNWKKLPPDELQAMRLGRAAYITRELDALPPIRSPDPATSPITARETYMDAIANLQQRIEGLPDQPPARINARWDGASVGMLGIRATSTSGTANALRNWVQAVAQRASADA